MYDCFSTHSSIDGHLGGLHSSIDEPLGGLHSSSSIDGPLGGLPVLGAVSVSV